MNLNHLLLSALIASVLTTPGFSQLKDFDAASGIFKDTTFTRFMRSYVDDFRNGEGVAVLDFQRNDGRTVEIGLYAYAFLTELNRNPPNNYIRFEGRIVLVYDGSELTAKRPQRWYHELKALIGNRLCDNTLPRTGQGVEVLHCMFNFDPAHWKLFFEQEKLVRKHRYF